MGEDPEPMVYDLKTFILSFIPLFVAIDVLGLVPIFISLTSEMGAQQKKKLITDATLTALAVSLIFIFGGRMIFNFLGITENDFRVGGGIVLLVLAVDELLFAAERGRTPETISWHCADWHSAHHRSCSAYNAAHHC